MSQGQEKEMSVRIPVGISSCLLGAPVRYNGGHKRSRYCLDVLADCFAFEPFCPEMAIGLGVPREPIRLVAEANQPPRAQGTVDASLDVTADLLAYGDRLGREARHLCGYILTKGSPSCGMERVKVYHPNGMPNSADSGIFVRALREANPVLPVEEEARLNDPVLRENFIARVFAYDDWKRQVEAEPSYHQLIRFHSRQKYLLMAHHYQGYRQLGHFLAEAHRLPLEQAMAEYLQAFMGHLGHRASPRDPHQCAAACVRLPEEGDRCRVQTGVAGADRGVPGWSGAPRRASDPADPLSAPSWQRLYPCPDLLQPLSAPAGVAQFHLKGSC